MERKNSMGKKINMQFMIIAAVAILITAVSAMILFYVAFTNQIYDDLKTCATIISDIHDMTDETIAEELRITLIDKDGVVHYDNSGDTKELENPKKCPEIVEARENGEGKAIRWSDTGAVHILYYAIRFEDGSVLRVGKESDSLFGILKKMVYLTIIIAIIVLGTCFWLSRYLTKRLLRPIEKMAVGWDGFTHDTIYSELNPFITTIKEQHINILNHAKLRQEFTANVSHELKTPLTAISGYAELIGSGMADEKDILHFADEIYKSSDRLLTLINDILKLSELDDSEQEFDTEPVNLFHAAQNCIAMMEYQAMKQEIALRVKGEPCTINANKNLIDELLYNLCSNAIRYNNRGGSVEISVYRQDSRVFLMVKDTGIGIKEEYQTRVFERFYRVDKSRSKESGGTGLGLAIVKHIVAQHNATIELSSENGKGTQVTIIF